MIDWFRIIADLERDYTQHQVGLVVGRNQSTINRYKQGLTEPSYSVGVALLILHAKQASKAV